MTLNEELDLPGCLGSVAWSDDVHVIDSLSTDRTREIASAYGAHVTQRRFDGYAAQRNAGLAIPMQHNWVLLLDADERVPPKLSEELLRLVSNVPEEVSAMRIRRRDYWWGKHLKHAQISPYFVRLVRRGKVTYEREINEVLVVDGDILDVSEPFDHFPFSKGLRHWIDKHNRYSDMEAQLIASGGTIVPSLRTALFSGDFNERRIHQKAIFYGLPGRPIIKFFYMMIGRLAFLDGWPGVRYSLLQAVYEYFIVLKTKEHMLSAREQPRKGAT